MPITLSIKGDRELIAKLDAMPNRVKAEMFASVTKLAFKLEAKVKDEKLSGQVLHVKSGALRRSIFSTVDQSSTAVMGKVASSGDVKYAAIHEFGGTIKHPGGTPYMSFEGKTYFVSLANAKNLNLPVTKAHSIAMPERSFMRSSLKDMRDEIISELTQALKRGTKIK